MTNALKIATVLLGLGVSVYAIAELSVDDFKAWNISNGVTKDETAQTLATFEIELAHGKRQYCETMKRKFPRLRAGNCATLEETQYLGTVENLSRLMDVVSIRPSATSLLNDLDSPTYVELLRKDSRILMTGRAYSKTSKRVIKLYPVQLILRLQILAEAYSLKEIIYKRFPDLRGQLTEKDLQELE